jgi:hypothetical protein
MRFLHIKRAGPETSTSFPVDLTEFMTTPLFSIIVPLEYHRGQWEQCWLGWQAQTLPKSKYEVILVVPPDFAQREKLPAMLGPGDRIEYSTEHHDIGLSAQGAARAGGQFLFFTESHCWPEPDVLEKCLHAFTAHPEWAALSCRSIRVTHNRLSSAEADMYEGDIDYGMKSHPWRKVLDQCFVTRRDIYDECGGLKSELGHFSEWVIAANYCERGHEIGYLAEAIVYHYYIGKLAELRTFTRDFITGEMRYFAKEPHEPGTHLLDVPPQWICQGSWDRRLARSLLRIAMHDMLVPSAARPPRPRMFARTLMRWLTPAIVGDGAARVGATVKVGWAFAAARLATLVGSKVRLSGAFKNYVAALIDHQRLEYIKSERHAQAKTAGNPQVDSAAGWNVFAPENAGFYPIETSHGTKFRWSETAAIMPAWMPAGQHHICIEYLPVRSLMHGVNVQFYLNERPLSARDVSIGPDTIEIKLNLAQSSHSTLAWTCPPFPATGDRRWLGLPVKRVVWNPDPISSASRMAEKP